MVVSVDEMGHWFDTLESTESQGGLTFLPIFFVKCCTKGETLMSNTPSLVLNFVCFKGDKTTMQFITLSTNQYSTIFHFPAKNHGIYY